jgi:hypothetical protein
MKKEEGGVIRRRRRRRKKERRERERKRKGTHPVHLLGRVVETITVPVLRGPSVSRQFDCRLWLGLLDEKGRSG